MCRKLKFCQALLLAMLVSVSAFGQHEYYSIADLYVDYNYYKTTSEGDEIILVGYFTNSAESLMVENYWDFFAERTIHPDSFVICRGNLPSEMFSYHQLSITGILGSRPIDYPYMDRNTHLTVNIQSYEVVGYPPSYPIDLDSQDPIELDPTAGEPDICCNFVVIISGGVNHANNHIRYWNNISEKYAAYRNSEQYQAANITVFYL